MDLRKRNKVETLDVILVAELSKSLQFLKYFSLEYTINLCMYVTSVEHPDIL